MHRAPHPAGRATLALLLAAWAAAMAPSALAAPTATFSATADTARGALIAACEDGVLQITLASASRPPHDVLMIELEGQLVGRVRARWRGDQLALPAGSALEIGGWLAKSRPFALMADGETATPRWGFAPTPHHEGAAAIQDVLRACDVGPASP